jgi:hypothetical protein
MALYTELDRLLIDGRIDDEAPESNFLPLSVLDNKITQDSIRTQLNGRILDGTLPKRIFFQAKKVFTILVLIDEPRAVQELIQQDDITDEDLPLSRKGPRGHRDYDVLVSVHRKKTFHSFASWKELSKVKSFLSQQWAVQAPVLEFIGQHLTLDSQCPFPFIESMEMSAGGGGGVVYRSKIHPAHQRVFKVCTPLLKDYCGS